MNAKHTSWVLDECRDANGFYTVRIADGSPNGDTGACPIATVYQDHNAALIAAAPDMLAAHDPAASELAAQLLALYVDGDTADIDAGEVRSVIERLTQSAMRARAAIAKARAEVTP